MATIREPKTLQLDFFLYLDEKTHGLQLQNQRMFSVPTYSLMQQSFLRQMQVNGERHNCDVCEKSFSSVYSLGRHKQMFHVQGKTNCCRECGKSFFNSYLLKRHLLSHSSDRPFICPVCGKTYKYKHDLKNHCLAHAN